MAGEPADVRARAGAAAPWWAYVWLLGALAVGVGLLGAGAFNPDDGFLLRSEALWRVFGLAAYVGFAVGFLLVLMAAVRLVLWLARRGQRAG